MTDESDVAYVYYRYSADRGSRAEIRIMSHRRLRPKDCDGLEVARVPRSQVVMFLDGTASLSEYALSIVDDEVVFHKIEMSTNLVVNAETMRMIGKTRPKLGGIRINVRSGRISLDIEDRAIMLTGLPDNARVSIYLSEFADPNRPIESWACSIGDIRSGTLDIGFPKGSPSKEYTIWAVSPDPMLEMWWTDD